MKMLIGCAIVCLVTVNGPSDGADERRMPTAPTTGLEDRIRQVSELQLSLTKNGGTAEAAAKALRTFRAMKVRINEPGGVFLTYFRGRLEALSNHRPAAWATFASLASQASVSPEAVVGLRELDARNGKPWFRYRQDLARLLPLSSWARSSDGRATQRDALVARLPIPMRSREKLLRIAELLGRMRMWPEAADAYREAIYGAFSLPWILQRAFESWLSPWSADAWLKAAEAEWHNGRINVAADYLLKATTYGKQEHLTKGLSLAKAWSKSTTQPATRPAATEPAAGAAKPDPKLLREIAALYAQMNMHPRSVAILAAHAEIIGEDAEDLLAQYEKEWADLLNQYYAAVRGQVTLFGQKVPRGAKAATVTIPIPCRPEVLKELPQAVRQK